VGEEKNVSMMEATTMHLKYNAAASQMQALSGITLPNDPSKYFN